MGVGLAVKYSALTSWRTMKSSNRSCGGTTTGNHGKSIGTTCEYENTLRKKSPASKDTWRLESGSSDSRKCMRYVSLLTSCIHRAELYPRHGVPPSDFRDALPHSAAGSLSMQCQYAAWGRGPRYGRLQRGHDRPARFVTTLNDSGVTQRRRRTSRPGSTSVCSVTISSCKLQ